jgi:hypothetical protein
MQTDSIAVVKLDVRHEEGGLMITCRVARPRSRRLIRSIVRSV